MADDEQAARAYFERHRRAIEVELERAVDSVLLCHAASNPVLEVGKRLLESQGVDTAHIPATAAAPPRRSSPSLHVEAAIAAGLKAAGRGGGATARTDSPSDVYTWSARTWVRSLGVDELLAEALCAPLEAALAKAAPPQSYDPDAPAPSIDPDAQLAYIRHLGEHGSVFEMRALLSSAAAQVADRVQQGAGRLCQGFATQQELSSKFQMESELKYGTLDDFYAGLEAAVGLPNTDLEDAIKREHAEREDSHELFETTNYGMRTSSEIEHYFVVDPERGRQVLREELKQASPDLPEGTYPKEPRIALRKRRVERTLNCFDAARSDINVRLKAAAQHPLSLAELISARLYTGPLYIKYNSVMRGVGPGKDPSAQEHWWALCKGNKYTTTIWSINSAIVKLGKLTRAAKVYRGVSMRGLPKQLREANENGVIGAVDFAFASTTLDREVAEAYARRGGIIFEITQGFIDRGADVAWLSQYPFEREILFAPLTGLELIATRVEGQSLVLEMRIVVNQAAPTIDEVVRKLQRSHVQFVDILIHHFERGGVPSDALQPLKTVKKSAMLREPEWYNQTKNYKAATEAALRAKADVFRSLVNPTHWATLRIGRHFVAALQRSLGKTGEEVKEGGSSSAWPTLGSQSTAPSLVAEQMFLSATLCASEGEVHAAVSLLQQSLKRCGTNHPRVRAADIERVDGILDAAQDDDRSGDSGSGDSGSFSSKGAITIGGGSGATTRIQLDLRTHLQIASMLLGSSHIEPWLTTLATLGSSDERSSEKPGSVASPDETRRGATPLATRAFVALLRERALVPGEQLEPTRAVLAYDQGGWHKGYFVSKRSAGVDKRGQEASSYEVRLLSGGVLHTRYVHLASDKGSIGALLRTAAARENGLGLVRELLRSRVSILHADRKGNTALHVAVRHGHADICRLLVEHGAEAFEANTQGLRPYDISLNANNSEVRCILKPTNMHKELGNTDDSQPPLLLLARRSQTELCNRLSELRSPEGVVLGVDEADSKGVTALMVACERGIEDSVRELLRVRADPMLQTKSGCTALTIAAECNKPLVVELLLDHQVQAGGAAVSLVNLAEKGNVTALMRAAQNGNDEVVETLIERGASLNELRTDTQRTALALAARNGNSRCVRLLLDADADATLHDNEGQTPLLSAARFGHADAIELLVQHFGPQSVELRSVDGETPLLCAAMFGHEAAVRTLLLLGAHPAVSDSSGNTPLMRACLHNHEKLLPYFLQEGAPLDHTNDDGRTALMLCAAGGHLSSVEMLIQAGAGLLTRGPDGVTPLMLACDSSDSGAAMIAAFVHGARACVAGGGDGSDATTQPPPQQHEDDEENGTRAYTMVVQEGPPNGASRRAAVLEGDAALKGDALHKASSADVVKARMQSLDAAKSVSHVLDAADSQSRTALMHAAMCGHAELVRTLLLANASRFAKDVNGHTAMMLAFERGEAGEDTLREFRSAGSALMEHECPPLCAFDGKSDLEVPDDEQLGVGGMVVDVGTGEIKLLAALRFESVVLEELALHKRSVLECIDEGFGHPTDRAQMTPSFAALTDRLASGIDELEKKAYFLRVTWTHCFVGATAWYRELAKGDPAQKARADGWLTALRVNLDAHLKRLRLQPLGASWSVLTAFEEGRYESIAVEYALRRAATEGSGAGLHPPVAVLAGGSGSVQITALDSLHSFYAPLRRGMGIIKDAPAREYQARLELWRQEVLASLGTSPVCNLMARRAEAQQHDGGEPLRIVLISAFFYSGLNAAGLVKRGERPRYHPAALVDERLRQFTLKADISSQDDLKEVVNAERIRSILHGIFGEFLGQVEIIFARDWKFKAGNGATVDFRMTWTAGWWLDELTSLYRRDTEQEPWR